MYFTLRAHLSSDGLHFKGLMATWWVAPGPHWYPRPWAVLELTGSGISVPQGLGKDWVPLTTLPCHRWALAVPTVPRADPKTSMAPVLAHKSHRWGRGKKEVQPKVMMAWSCHRETLKGGGKEEEKARGAAPTLRSRTEDSGRARGGEDRRPA